ncbi:PRD domain-containing protein [Ligilactobacillus murinus]|uniref:Antitermination protein BlgG n=1 Tax=Ligilactobacillus murinus TaxID=1622 RepID=A0AAD0P816_9LACO|nr:PRD domain-containing protein [Ligilactobacillus murinus]AWZ38719.1 antitermination protein BlgG [Ligilactobacillus murinus]AWZ40306.1 antitermination protein BlgG [Ligilactobacillus murinus]HBV47905.1 antitermination protein BlgG [Lactobacillus sp.]HCM79527.1 antitermination protein BlgG [Lactobacillus sp.]
MRFLKSYNNSVALVENEQGKEEIVIGKGIGFGLKKGDQIDQEKIERRFITAEDQESIMQLKDISAKTLELTTKVIKLAEPKLNIKFNDFQYLALADHIDFALTRSEDSIDMNATNTRWEVRNLFPEEYAVAKDAISVIEKATAQKLPASESILMTYHFVNATSDDAKLQETIQITQLITEIIKIVSYEYQLELDQQSFNYSRFVSHLRTLLVRLLKDKQQEGAQLDPALLQLMQVKYTRAYETAERIAVLLNAKMGWQLEADELVYLTLHIFRVTSRQANTN